MQRDQRNEIKAKVRKLKLPSISGHHYRQGLHSMTMAYRAKLYQVKFHLKPKEIADRLDVTCSRVYELLRKLG